MTKKLKTTIRRRVKRNSEHSIMKLASELKTSGRSVRRAMNEMNMKTVAVAKTIPVDRKFKNEEIGWLRENSEHVLKSVHR